MNAVITLSLDLFWSILVGVGQIVRCGLLGSALRDLAAAIFKSNFADWSHVRGLTRTRRYEQLGQNLGKGSKFQNDNWMAKIDDSAALMHGKPTSGTPNSKFRILHEL